MNSVQGFILSYLKYSDNDALIHCFTKENGYESFFCKGIYSTKNKRKAYLQPLNEVAIYLPNKQTGSIKNISKIELLQNVGTDSDIKTGTIVFFIADFLNQILRNEVGNSDIYNEISNIAFELKSGNTQSHLIFLFKILKINGLHPLNSHYPYLDPERGYFKPEKSHNFFDSDISKIWKELISGVDLYKIRIPSKLRKDFLESLLVYYHYHFTDFRTPKSLQILKEIFD